MAAAEARAMLDALMGGDRDAPLPAGAAMPLSKKKKRKAAGGEMLLLPGKRSKSCFDNDIDPLYCAWGVDVYELFVNTKSDIGPNPYQVDEGARQEFLKLSPPEQERLGFHYFLYQKLQELVRSGDRTVARNKEKLAQELRRLAAKRGANPSQQPVVDYVKDVDEQAVEAVARNQLELEFLQEKLDTELLPKLNDMQEQEDHLKEELSKLLGEQREMDEQFKKKTLEDSAMQEEKEKEATEDDKGTDIQQEGEEATKVKQEEDDNDNKENTATSEEATQVKQEEKEEENNNDKSQPEKNPRTQELQVELGKLTLQKQKVLWEVSRTLSQTGPLQEGIDGQHRNLLYVKSDIAVDKTVCEVSGNFMSARDADERIAAHYAGKQYVGWKLVREKFKEMMAKYGRYGPPPPDRRGGSAGAPMGMHNSRGGGPPPSRGGGYGGGGRGGGGFDRDRGGGGGYGGGGGGYGGRGRGRFDSGRGPPDRGGRWERHGPGGPPRGDYNRGGGGRGGWRR
ncbi:expressed unknown protein [Seminavis robusta]|uniref:Uncharacterized protein n=1 Tax=Seminavis robusta TaxID=568900 RepID=A0A9N8E2E6_9STRA|nr:expressed unknown protein [Seminavis robusta]|eukprot:Sro584_g170900.1 n/a (510) ;mRNA; r:56483-58012